jgi:pilus assembly protein CpaB
MSKGQPITGQFLSAVGSGAGLAGKIPDGMRAIALRSDEIVGVAGFLLPDSHVDVLATIHTDKMPEPTTFVVLQNAQVLAAGRQLEPDPEGKPSVVTVLTLLLSPADAERAVLASLQGTIHFILRSGSDSGTPDSPSLDVAQLVGRASSPDAGTPVSPRRILKVVDVKPPAPVLTVETIAGDKQTTDTFKVGQP